MIIGITGLPCSGSDTLGRILVDKGFTWMSYSDLLREELNLEGKEITRESMQDLANQIREGHGAGELSRRLLQKMKSGEKHVIGTIRNPGEVDFLRDSGKQFILLRIEAPQEIRFQRMKKRNRENDPVDFEEFKKLEEMELGGNQESHGLQIRKCLDRADHIVVNDSTIEGLREKADSLLNDLGFKIQNS